MRFLERTVVSNVPMLASPGCWSPCKNLEIHTLGLGFNQGL